MAESTKSTISRVIFKDKAPWRFLVSVTLYLVTSGLGIYDIYTDWEVVVQYQRNGFNHPLLPIDFNWLRAWYFFTVFGTIFTSLSILNESVHIFYSMWLFFPKHLGKLFRCHREMNKGGKVNSFEMKETKPDSETEKEIVDKEKEGKGKDMVVTDACKYCYDYGWNFITRGHTIGIFNFWLQQFPLLVLAFLYALTLATCKTPEKKDISGDMFAVARSSSVTAASALFKLICAMVQLCSSLALRMKSKKEFEKMGKCGKVLSKVLPEKGDAIYPPDTCAQYCFIPFSFMLLFEFALVCTAFGLSSHTWKVYLDVRSLQNFESSLAIFRDTTESTEIVRLLNISDNIIPASNGSFLSFETIQGAGVIDKEIIHCLSEFEYKEEKHDIFFNTIEIEAISVDGKFCAIKTGSENIFNKKTYSRCTPYYTVPFLRHFGHYRYTLFYGYTLDSAYDQPKDLFDHKNFIQKFNLSSYFGQEFHSLFINDEIKRFDEECDLYSFGFSHVRRGPAFDLSIQVDKNIDHTDHPNTSQPLLIFFVDVQDSTTTIHFNVSVADIVAQSMGLSYVHTFRDPSDGAKVTYHTHFRYDYATKQVMYNAKDAINPNMISCRCSSQLPKKLTTTGIFLYGYYDEQTGNRQLLTTCSNIPFALLIPRHNPKLYVDCCN